MTMRRKATAEDRVQPRAGERWVCCKHIDGDPTTGFIGAHVLFIEGGMLASAERCPDVMARDLGKGVWLFVCDACADRRRIAPDVEVIGRDGIWPEGSEITYADEGPGNEAQNEG
jgi:hypothetical protein